MSKTHGAVAEQFASDVADHKMTILLDQGVYRHVRFNKPGTSFYRFDLVTWPGHLAISGDMDGFVFARVEDMFTFFRSESGWNGARINPVYWSEKVCSGGRPATMRYSEEKFRQHVADHIADFVEEYPGLAAAVEEEIFDGGASLFEDSARQALDYFEYVEDGPRHTIFRFLDTQEWELRDFSHQFLWCCHAIQWGIAQYDAAKSAEAVAR